MSAENPLKQIFLKNIDIHNSRHEEFKKLHVTWSIIRLLVFITFLGAILFMANQRAGEAVAALLISFPFIFFFIVKKHNKIAFDRNHQLFLVRINQQEIERLSHKLGAFDTGDEFKDNLHPFCNDLDVFGQHSLFQLLNRTSTPGGKQELAGWLLKPANQQDILLRQEATKEIGDNQSWRQEFQAHGMHVTNEEKNIGQLLSWMKSPDKDKSANKFSTLRFIMPLLSGAGIVIWFMGYGYFFLLACLIVNGSILASISKTMKDISMFTEKGALALKAYLRLFRMLEDRKFDTSMNTALQSSLLHDGIKASSAIKTLQKILYNLDSRSNIFYWILNAMFLLDLFLLVRARHWKKAHQKYVEQWFEAIHVMEVINSLAGFSAINPSFSYPHFTDKPFEVEGLSIGHPLIPSASVVCNDIRTGETLKINIVTGSNMSGKSTFLRTLGTNLVLAQIGAPVFAKSLKFIPCRLFTSMRTQDNLEESVSSFYAELKRLKQLLDAIDQGVPHLFLLDEILKGTNSEDRNKGAASLIKQLLPLNAFGFVSTHDLALGSLAEKNTGIRNLSFNSTIKGNEISFDYKLHEGICTSFNASKLMQNMGIDIAD